MPTFPDGGHVSAGYYLACRLPSPSACFSKNPVPENAISASTAISGFFPDAWAIEWTSEKQEERLRQAALFGISPTDLPAVVEWATASLSEAFGWSNVFYSLEAARKARARFIPEDCDGIINFGLGLHPSDVEEFLDSSRPPPREPGFAPVGESGIFQCVRAGEDLAHGGEAAGFDFVGTMFGILGSSWLCYGLEKRCANELGVMTNRHGLVSSYAEAVRCAELISESRVSPEQWFPWLVNIYPGN